MHLPRLTPFNEALSLSLRGRLLAAAFSAAVLVGCCDKPPCTDPHAPGCGPDAGTCPTIADLASGAGIPPIEACAISIWICALDKDFLDARASGTFIDEAGYRARWAARVETGWLPLTKHLQTQAGANEALKMSAWKLEDTVTTLTDSADNRRRLIEDGYLFDLARELYDVASATPGLAPACPRP